MLLHHATHCFTACHTSLQCHTSLHVTRLTLLPPLLHVAFQGPLCRFGDTAANAGVLSLLNEFEATAGLPVGLKTAAASAAAGAWRMLLLPLDATKTMMQVGQWGEVDACLVVFPLLLG